MGVAFPEQSRIEPCFDVTDKTDPDTAIRLLKETLGNQNCRVVVSLKRAMITQRGKHVPICLKRIVLHNPQTQAYCVLVWDGKELKLVSWNNAGDDYGDSEWTLK